MTTLPPQFWAKTRTTDCLLWFGAVNTKGYPCFAISGKSQLAHRLAYEDANGPIPEGMTIDHTCRVRSCVNVDHLEVVSIAENNRRKKTAGGLHIGDRCIKDHEITEVTIYRRPNGFTECRVCRNEQKRRARSQTPAPEDNPRSLGAA